MTVAVRPATADDENEIVALWTACGLVTAYNDPGKDFRFALDGACSDVLVGRDENCEIVGTVMVGHDGHRGWLYYVASAPGERRQGIGRTMVEAGEQWLRRRSVPKVQLMVRETNTAVVSFYERLGYEDMPRILMSKWLERPE